MRRRIDILKGVSDQRLAQATADAANRHPEVLPALSFTEGNPRWVLLYDHAQVGQIRPEKMKRMRRDDLEFLAGMTQGHGDLNEDQATKLAGNVARARDTLERRSRFRTAAGAAVIGAAVGAAISLAAHAGPDTRWQERQRDILRRIEHQLVVPSHTPTPTQSP